jgi:hypothetical protein
MSEKFALLNFIKALDGFLSNATPQTGNNSAPSSASSNSNNAPLEQVDSKENTSGYATPAHKGNDEKGKAMPRYNAMVSVLERHEAIANRLHRQ